MPTYSSRQAAQRLGIAIATLSNYIAQGKIPEPKSLTTGGITVHIWTEEEIERARQLLPKIANGRKTRWQKKKAQARVPVPHKRKSTRKKK